jgi:Flp pilus assembly protein TadD
MKPASPFATVAKDREFLIVRLQEFSQLSLHRMSRRSKRMATQDRAPARRPNAPISPDKEKMKAGREVLGVEKDKARANDRRIVLVICIFLAAIIWAVYGQTLRYGFVNYDDGICVYDNPAVTAGLTLEGIAPAFRSGEPDNWVPLTTISHMLDCQFYGLNAGGHHLTNVILHTLSAIFLFLVLWKMTGALWSSVFVTTIFAIHPLHVESVAWVAERKDVLSGFFFMLTLLAYAFYVHGPRSFPRYLMVLFLFACGLMSKPMLVTLPFVLLLLDYWPLNRFSGVDSSHWFKNFSVPIQLVIEKIPLFFLSLVSCISTVLVQGQGHTIQSLDKIHFSTRIGNALVSYVTYVWQMFYPVGLAPYYPYAGDELSFWKIIGAFVILAAISGGVFLARQKRPYLLVGWLWYLGMLVPVVGIVQVGSQAMADRYTYLPEIGLSLMLVWLAADLSAGWRNRRLILGSFATVITMGMLFSARLQASYWKNSETLWTHTIAVTSNNSFAHNNLGAALTRGGQVDEGITQLQRAVAINPGFAKGWDDLGLAHSQNGQLGEAIIQFKKALAINPNNAQAHYNLGAALAEKGQVDAAIAEYQAALALNPNDSDTCNNLGYALAQKGQIDEATVQFQRALAIDPNDARAYNNLGGALAQKGQMDQAIVQFQKALVIDPNDARTCNELGGALAQKGRVDEAILAYKKALAINPQDAQTCYNLGDVLSQKGQVDEAIIQFKRALAINPNYAQACNNLGNALAQKGQMNEAIVQFQKALALQPGFVAAQNNLMHAAWLLATSPNPSLRNGAKALEIAQQTDHLTGGDNPTMVATLAAADAEVGKFTEAIANVQRALQLASSQANVAMVADLRAQLKCYQSNSPYRDSGPVP